MTWNEEQLLKNPNFIKWFGNSRVVDEKGNPLVVYHSTNEKFDTFKKSFIGKNYNYGFKKYDLGFYFSNLNDPHYGKEIYSCYLKIENPLIIEDYGWETSISMIDTLYSDIKRWLNNDNYDGIICHTEEDNEIVYVVFNSNQIKSINNNGDFSSESNNIYESRSYTPNQLKKMMYNREYKSQNPYKDELYHGYADEFATKMVNNFSEEDWKYAADWANSLEFPLKVYRGIQVKSKEDIRLDKLGNHWTTDPEMFNNRSTIGVGKMNYILSGYVDEKDIDWAKTMDNFMYYSINSQNKRYGAYPENEIYVRSSAKVKDLEIEERV